MAPEAAAPGAQAAGSAAELALQQRQLAPERSFLPRTIDFVPATGSSAAPDGSGEAADEVDRDGPVPTYYLYPRDRLRELCERRVPRPVGRGLRNAGNTCFFNSVLQALTHTPPLQSFLLSGEHAKGCQATGRGGFCALCLFEGHAREALTDGKSPVMPRALLRRLRELGGRSMRLGRQEDAHEFLRHFLDACHRAALRPASERGGEVPPAVQHTTLVHQLFGGYLRSQVMCLECRHESNTFDPFLDLSLEVRTAASLEKALEGFTKSERLTGRNRYRCKRCKNLVDATKRFSIHAAPPLLTFQLKRFDYSQGFRGKIAKNVSFETSVDLARFTSRPELEAKYRLYAVIVHRGSSARSGHYYAFARHASGKWYHFDDEVVRAVPEQTVLRQEAYLLFYETTQPSALTPRNTSVPASPATELKLGRAAPLVNGHVNGHVNGTAVSNGRCTSGAAGGAPSAEVPAKPPVNGQAAELAAPSCKKRRHSNVEKADPVASPRAEAAELPAPPCKKRRRGDAVEEPADAAAPVAAPGAAADETSLPQRKRCPGSTGELVNGTAVLPTTGAGSGAARACPALKKRRRNSRFSRLLRLSAKLPRVMVPIGVDPSSPSRRLPSCARKPAPPVATARKRRRSAADPTAPASRPAAASLPAAPPEAPGAAEAARQQEPEERATLASSYATQFGLAKVDRWGDDGADEEGEAAATDGDAANSAALFEEAQRRLQPPPQRRDELDAEYDVGKRKHRPKQAKAAFNGKSIFDEEERRRRAGGGRKGGRPGGWRKGGGKSRPAWRGFK